MRPSLSSLLDQVEVVRVEGASLLDGALVRAQVVGLTAVASAVEAARLEAIGSLASSGAFEADGSATAPGWLARNTPTDRKTAAGDLRCAQRLAAVPEVAAALREGRIGARAARMLADAAAAGPVAFAELQDAFSEVAARGALQDLRNVLREWTQLVRPPGEPGGDDDYEALVAGRALHLSTSLDGVAYLDGRFDPTSGAQIVAAVDARAAWLRRRDIDAQKAAADAAKEQGVEYVPEALRAPAQYRADALLDLVHAGADALARGEGTGEDDTRTPACSTRVSLRLDAADVLCLPGKEHDPGDLIPVTLNDVPLLLPRSEIDTLTCDCHLRRIIIGADGEILDVGREKRTATPAQRTALTERDGCCIFPGCDRPPRWCDAHHIHEWDHHGPTDLYNLALLCRRHHRLMHRKTGWTIRTDPNGIPIVMFNGVDQPRNPRPLRLRDLLTTAGRPPPGG